MKVTNISRALQGVHTEGGVVYLRPGQSRDVTLTKEGAKQADRLPFLLIGEGDKPKTAKVEPPVRTPAPAGSGDEPKTAVEVLAMATASDVPFMTFKAAAVKLLGDQTPAKKSEIIAALEDLATRP